MHEQLRADLIAEAHALAASIGMKFVPHAPKEPKMQTDIVERLRDTEFAGPMRHLQDWSEIDALMSEAAETIATLRREVEQARAKALEEAIVAVNALPAMARPAIEFACHARAADAIRSLADKEG